MRHDFSDRDESEDIISGIDVVDYFGTKFIDMSKILPLAHSIERVCGEIRNVVVVGVERKGFALLGAMLDEIDSDIKPNRNRTLTKEMVKNKNVILFDDAAHTGGTILKEVAKLKKYGAREIYVFVILTTNTAYNIIKRKKIGIYPHFTCDDNSYSALYSAFYDMVNASVIPVTGEPTDQIEFDEDNIYEIPFILGGLRHGTPFMIESYDNSSPIRATVDYYDYVNNGGHELFKEIGNKTGFYITVDQVKVRLFFSYKDDRAIIKLKPIIYFDFLESYECNRLKECEEEGGSPPSSEKCRNCIENWFSKILIEDLKDEIDRLR